MSDVLIYAETADGGTTIKKSGAEIATLGRKLADALGGRLVAVVPADIADAGATTAPAHTLYDIVRKLPDGAQLEIEQGPDDHRLSVRCGRSQFSLQALPSEDFPDLSTGDLDHRFTMSAGYDGVAMAVLG